MTPATIEAAHLARIRIGARSPRGGYWQAPSCHCCGACYPLVQDWRRLEFVGEMTDPGDGVVPERVLQLRNCECGITLAREIEA